MSVVWMYGCRCGAQSLGFESTSRRVRLLANTPVRARIVTITVRRWVMIHWAKGRKTRERALSRPVLEVDMEGVRYVVVTTQLTTTEDGGLLCSGCYTVGAVDSTVKAL